jgi:hypothetical protein
MHVPTLPIRQNTLIPHFMKNAGLVIRYWLFVICIPTSAFLIFSNN